MANNEITVAGNNFKDRKIGLVIFGILEIILGAFCALLVPFIILGMVVSATLNKNPATPMNVGIMIFSVLFYVVLSVWFIWMGIGSIKARRWARALLLVSSWLWFISGISGLIFMLTLMPDMFNQMVQSGQMPKEGAAIMKYVMFGFLTVFFIIIPGVLILFYGNKNVKKTCESRDSHVRWTDKCPLPVLALSLIYGYCAVSMLLLGFYGWAIPFFGYILNGIAGAVVALVAMLLFGYIAWGMYKLSIKAWWCAVLVIIAWAVSTGITFSRVSLMDFYEKMNFPKQQLEIMKQYSMPQFSTMALFFGIWVIGFLGYLLYTRKYFVSPSIPDQSVNTIHNPEK
jgi:MFS family permease